LDISGKGHIASCPALQQICKITEKSKKPPLTNDIGMKQTAVIHAQRTSVVAMVEK
jgi:hypothetical protein